MWSKVFKCWSGICKTWSGICVHVSWYMHGILVQLTFNAMELYCTCNSWTITLKYVVLKRIKCTRVQILSITQRLLFTHYHYNILSDGGLLLIIESNKSLQSRISDYDVFQIQVTRLYSNADLLDEMWCKIGENICKLLKRINSSVMFKTNPYICISKCQMS
eukprot:7504_1